MCLCNHFRFRGALSSAGVETLPAIDCLFLYAQHNDEQEKATSLTGAIQLQRVGKPKEKRGQLFFSTLQNYLINLGYSDNRQCT